MTGNNPSLFC